MPASPTPKFPFSFETLPCGQLRIGHKVFLRGEAIVSAFFSASELAGWTIARTEGSDTVLLEKCGLEVRFTFSPDDGSWLQNVVENDNEFNSQVPEVEAAPRHAADSLLPLPSDAETAWTAIPIPVNANGEFTVGGLDGIAFCAGGVNRFGNRIYHQHEPINELVGSHYIAYRAAGFRRTLSFTRVGESDAELRVYYDPNDGWQQLVKVTATAATKADAILWRLRQPFDFVSDWLVALVTSPLQLVDTVTQKLGLLAIPVLAPFVFTRYLFVASRWFLWSFWRRAFWGYTVWVFVCLVGFTGTIVSQLTSDVFDLLSLLFELATLEIF